MTTTVSGLPEEVRSDARQAGTLAAHALALDPFRPGEWLQNGQRLLAETSADAAAEVAYAAGRADERARVATGIIPDDQMPRRWDDRLAAPASSPQEGGGGLPGRDTEDGRAIYRVEQFALQYNHHQPDSAAWTDLGRDLRVSDLRRVLAVLNRVAAPPPAGVQLDREAGEAAPYADVPPGHYVREDPDYGEVLVRTPNLPSKVDREVAERIADVVLGYRAHEFINATKTCACGKRPPTFDAWRDHYYDSLAAALAPLLGTPGDDEGGYAFCLTCALPRERHDHPIEGHAPHEFRPAL